VAHSRLFHKVQIFQQSIEKLASNDHTVFWRKAFFSKDFENTSDKTTAASNGT